MTLWRINVSFYLELIMWPGKRLRMSAGDEVTSFSVARQQLKKQHKHHRVPSGLTDLYGYRAGYSPEQPVATLVVKVATYFGYPCSFWYQRLPSIIFQVAKTRGDQIHPALLLRVPLRHQPYPYKSVQYSTRESGLWTYRWTLAAWWDQHWSTPGWVMWAALEEDWGRFGPAGAREGGSRRTWSCCPVIIPWSDIVTLFKHLWGYRGHLTETAAFIDEAGCPVLALARVKKRKILLLHLLISKRDVALWTALRTLKCGVHR